MLSEFRGCVLLKMESFDFFIVKKSKLFCLIGNSYQIKKLLREDAHAKARKMSHKCDAFAARECALHILFLLA